MLSIKDLEAFMHINEALREKNGGGHESHAKAETSRGATPASLYLRHMKDRYKVYRTFWGME